MNSTIALLVGALVASAWLLLVLVRDMIRHRHD